MNTLLVLPILIPFFGAAVSMVFWRSPPVQKWIAVTGSGALLGAALVLMAEVWEHGILVTHLGDWPAPFAIPLVADLFSALMVGLTGLMGFVTAIYSLVSMDEARVRFGYFPLLQILLMGICGAFLTGDIFNLYVWFEVMLISSFVLLAMGGEKVQMEGAIKYVTLNLIASAVFLAGVGILYGLMGSLNMAELAIRFNVVNPNLALIVSLLFLIAFGIKAAVFPLFFWLPASYHTPPVAVSAIFAGLLTKVGVYALIRVFTLLFIHHITYTHTILLVVAALTMVTGVLGATAQFEFRRILSFHIISQIGYMIMGLALFTPLALLGSLFYIAHHIIVKSNLFLVSGVTYQYAGTYELKQLGGFYKRLPGLALLFAIPAFSLAGMPPLSGFFGKFILVKAGLEIEQYWIVGVALVVGILTLFSMTKIWAEVFWKESPREEKLRVLKPWKKGMLLAPIVLLAILTVLIGLGSGWLWDYCEKAAQQLLSPAAYIKAVLGGVP